ncbi:patatin-like phospholipase family protein [Gymnodinialimonas sp. 57CJ19]|uniref:patatin-like phospholipase family protein n=1 Tax=Gymnodinialimonas sp. 57CJ19 TaxID=3138498 RepID=UPI0031343A8E
MKTTTLVLGAGGARGVAHIHALRAFDDLGIKPTLIAGTSIGSIMGAAYAAGMSADEIEDHIMESFNDRKRLVTQAFKVRPNSVKSFLADGGLRLGEFNLETIFEVFLPKTIPQRFDDLSIPLKVIATDYYAARTQVFDAGPLRRALAASSAIPAVFLPVNIDDRYFVDGSTTDPCPLTYVQGTGDTVIAIDVSGGPSGDSAERPSKVEVMYTTGQIMQQSITRAQAAQYPDTQVLRPPVNNYRALDFLKVSEILSETEGLRELVKRQIDPR